MAADSAYRWLSKLPVLALLEVEWDDAALALGEAAPGQHVSGVIKRTAGYLHGVTEKGLEVACSLCPNSREDVYYLPLGCLQAVTVEGKRVEFGTSVRVRRPQGAPKRRSRR